MNVKREDRKKRIEYIRLILVMAQIRIDYKGADLIYKLMKKFFLYGGEVNIKQVTKIRSRWEEKWKDYDIDNAEVKYDEIAHNEVRDQSENLYAEDDLDLDGEPYEPDSKDEVSND